LIIELAPETYPQPSVFKLRHVQGACNGQKVPFVTEMGGQMLALHGAKNQLCTTDQKGQIPRNASR